MTDATQSAKARTADMKLEVVVIPVSDVDRAKAFYQTLGWRLMRTLLPVTTGAWFNSRRRARRHR